MYTLVWGRSAAKDMRKVPVRYLSLLIAKVEALCADPYPDGCKKIKGYANLYRLRQGEYRVIYRVDGIELVIMVVEVGHRRDVYRNF